MKKFTRNEVSAYRTKNPGMICDILNKIEKIELSNDIDDISIDIIDTIHRNLENDDAINNTCTSYLLRYAVYLFERGELVRAETKVD